MRQPKPQAVLDALPHVDALAKDLGIFGPEPALKITDKTWQRF